MAATMNVDSVAALKGYPGLAAALHVSGRFASLPVCEACWRDPQHRKRKLKAHFFKREQAQIAAARAGSSGRIGG